MTTKEHFDYEIEVKYLGITYLVYANLYDHGDYNVITKTHDDPGGFEILVDPEFCDYKVIDPETDLEVLPEDLDPILLIAENVLRELYWNQWMF